MDIDRLLRLFDFLSVALRAATLTFQSLTIGGILFLIFVLRPTAGEAQALRKTSRRWILRSAVALAATQLVYLAANLLVLIDSAELSLSQALGANLVLAASLRESSAEA